MRLALLLALAPLAARAEPAATAHPSEMVAYAAEAFGAGARDEGVFWFYLGQLRWRARLMAHPELDPSGEPAAFAALMETVGRPINEWAFGDIPALVATLDRVLAFDAENPDASIDTATARQGLAGMRDQVVAQADAIRAQRTANGLGNR